MLARNCIKQGPACPSHSLTFISRSLVEANCASRKQLFSRKIPSPLLPTVLVHALFHARWQEKFEGPTSGSGEEGQTNFPLARVGDVASKPPLLWSALQLSARLSSFKTYHTESPEVGTFFVRKAQSLVEWAQYGLWDSKRRQQGALN